MESNYPLVSICVPAYNHEKYVQECIRSIIEQDYQRVELLIIDDGSLDSTYQRIMELRNICVQRFERFEVERQDNKGTADTFLKLQRMARGKFIGFIASDDKYLPHAISTLIKPLMEDESIGVTVGINLLIDDTGKKCYWTRKRGIVYEERRAYWKSFSDFCEKTSGINFDGPDFGTYQSLVRENYIGNGALIRLDCLNKIVPFSSSAPLEDWWMHLQLSKQTRYKHIRENTFYYRWHMNNSIKRLEWISQARRKTIQYERRLVEDESQMKWRKFFYENYSLRQCLLHVPRVCSVFRVNKLNGDRYFTLKLFGFMERKLDRFWHWEKCVK